MRFPKYIVIIKLQSLKPKYSDWIALLKCNSNRNVEEFIAVETNLTINSPSKHGLNHVTFYTNQLKNIDCNLEYEFLYGNTFNEVVCLFVNFIMLSFLKYFINCLQICGVSRPIRFIHKNDCIFCYPNISETSHCNCVSQVIRHPLMFAFNIY